MTTLLVLALSMTLQPEAVVPPRPRGTSFTTDGDYPAEARRLGQQGVVGALLEVDRRGRVTGCSVVESSDAPSLDAATCEMFQELRYHPARDADGRAVAVSHKVRFRWTLSEASAGTP